MSLDCEYRNNRFWLAYHVYGNALAESKTLSDKKSIIYDYDQRNVKPQPQSVKKADYCCNICGVWKEEEIKIYLRGNLKIKKLNMERIVNLEIAKVPEGVYLATSDNIQGLVVQGNSITETIEIARDVAKKLIEAQEQQIENLAMFSNSFNYPLVVAV
jgi:predicted RNase H-like HicB family nuclease